MFFPKDVNVVGFLFFSEDATTRPPLRIFCTTSLVHQKRCRPKAFDTSRFLHQKPFLQFLHQYLYIFMQHKQEPFIPTTFCTRRIFNYTNQQNHTFYHPFYTNQTWIPNSRFVSPRSRGLSTAWERCMPRAGGQRKISTFGCNWFVGDRETGDV